MYLTSSSSPNGAALLEAAKHGDASKITELLQLSTSDVNYLDGHKNTHKDAHKDTHKDAHKEAHKGANEDAHKNACKDAHKDTHRRMCTFKHKVHVAQTSIRLLFHNDYSLCI